jgi:hypothetical protein
MALLEGKTTAERNKTIAALALGLIAFVFLARMFFGGSSETSTTTTTRRAATNANTNARTSTTTNAPAPGDLSANAPDPSLVVPQPIDYRPVTPGVPSVGRNIFAFYVPPPAPVKKTPDVILPPATPVPTPPLQLATISPANVFARTGDFALQVSGDKFTPQTRIYLDAQELPTRFINAQNLSTSVSANFITSPGGRQVIVRTPDNLLYSNSATLNISAPPTPDFTYVGVLIRPRGNDTAILKDKKGELTSVQRGDLVGGRFRVSSISAREVEFTDQQLKIKHTLPYSDPRFPAGQNNPAARFTPQPPPKTGEEEEVETEP